MSNIHANWVDNPCVLLTVAELRTNPLYKEEAICNHDDDSLE